MYCFDCTALQGYFRFLLELRWQLPTVGRSFRNLIVNAPVVHAGAKDEIGSGLGLGLGSGLGLGRGLGPVLYANPKGIETPDWQSQTREKLPERRQSQTTQVSGSKVRSGV